MGRVTFLVAGIMIAIGMVIILCAVMYLDLIHPRIIESVELPAPLPSSPPVNHSSIAAVEKPASNARAPSPQLPRAKRLPLPPTPTGPIFKHPPKPRAPAPLLPTPAQRRR